MSDKQLKEKVDLFIKFIPLIVFCFYALGYLVLNTYLSFFGVFEYTLLQTRYFSVGIIFAIYLCCALAGVWIMCKKIKNDFIKSIILSFAFSTFLIIYSFVIFPILPQFFGGARSIPVSLIGSPEQISFLGSFGIHPIANASSTPSVETMPVCILYQNQDFILIGSLVTSSRALYLKQDQIRGFQVRGGIVSDTRCPLYKFYGL